MLKKFILLTCIVLVYISGAAQTVKVRKEKVNISGQSVEGFEVDLDGDFKDVTTSFSKYIKTLGKLMQNGDYMMLSESTFNGKSYGLPIYGLTTEMQKLTQAWFGVKMNEWSTGDATKITKQLEKAIYNFGVKFYKDKIQEQTDESTRAFQVVETTTAFC